MMDSGVERYANPSALSTKGHRVYLAEIGKTHWQSHASLVFEIFDSLRAHRA